MPDDPAQDLAFLREHLDAEALHAHIAANDSVCPNCSYRLAGLANLRCPECGHQIDLHELAGHEARVRQWADPLRWFLAPLILGLVFLGCATFLLASIAAAGLLSLGLIPANVLGAIFALAGGALPFLFAWLLVHWLRWRRQVAEARRPSAAHKPRSTQPHT